MKDLILYSLLFGFCTFSFSLSAQNAIKGKITDPKGNVIPGVNINVKGEKNHGTSSDFDGNYELSSVSEQDTLVFQAITYETREVAIEGRSEVNVIMLDAKGKLDEVVVVGYGTQQKKDLTGAISSVDAEDLAKTPTANFDQALAGRIAGVQVTSTDGTPGDAMNIVIRGRNSITGDNSPLYVVDGVVLEDFDPGTISTDNIASFDVLKDASATAIYGSRGSNGVILITTKKGRDDGKTDVNVNAEYGLSWIPKRLEVLNPYDYVKNQLQVALSKDNYLPRNYAGFFQKTWVDPELYRNVKGTSWQNRVFQTAQTQKYHVAVSGGNKNTNIRYTAEYQDKKGTMLHSRYKKLINTLKINHDLSKKTHMYSYLQYTRLKRGGMIIRGNAYNSVIRDAIRFRPVEPVIDDGLGEGGYDPMDDATKYVYNPVKTLNNTTRNNNKDVIRGSLRLRHRFLPNLTLKLGGTYQLGLGKRNIFYGEDTRQAKRGPDGINGEETDNRVETLLSSNTLEYKKKFEEHDFDILGGLEFEYHKNRGLSASNADIPTDLFGMKKLGLGVSPGIPSTSLNNNSMFSYFGRVNYSFKDRYLFTANFRADGSSKFASGNRWGYFPSFAAAWKISEENFLKDIEVLNFAKFRLGWGRTGNNRIGSYQAFNQLDINYQSGYVWGKGENFQPGVFQSNLGVPDLRWETTNQWNVGMDLGFFDNRLNLTVDFYRKRTHDLLLNAEMALSTGFDRVQQNVGQTENKGLEVSINSINIDTEKFHWETDFNIYFNRNKTIALNQGQDAIYTDPNWDFRYSEYQYLTKVGQPVGMIYGLEYGGLYQLDDFNYDTKNDNYSLKDGVPDNGATPVAPGSIKFVDRNGDGTINAKDRTIIGDPHPDFEGGITNTLTWGNFDLSFLINWSYGFDILNANKTVFQAPRARRFNDFSGSANMWTHLNTNSDVNAIKYLQTFGIAPDGNQIDDRFVEDGSYLKIKSLDFGYSLPDSLISDWGVSKLRFHVSFHNLYTWTSYSGYDPDVSVGKYGALTPHLDYSAYPQSTTVMFGMNLTF